MSDRPAQDGVDDVQPESVAQDSDASPGGPASDDTDPVAGKTVAEILGEIVWLMTQDPKTRDMPIREIERLVMPAILLKQFHIKYARVGSGDAVLQPVAAEIYDSRSDERGSGKVRELDKSQLSNEPKQPVLELFHPALIRGSH